MDKISGIYIILNKANGNTYVGSSYSLRGRFLDHKLHLKKGTHCNSRLQNAWRKYKPWNFEFQILFLCKVEELIFWEQLAIDAYRDWIGWDKMYNISLDAVSPSKGRARTEIAKEKARITLAAKGGYKHSEETKRKIGETNKVSQKGKKLSEATRIKMSLSHQGKITSEEHCKNISISKRGKRIKPCTETHKENIRLGSIKHHQKLRLRRLEN